MNMFLEHLVLVVSLRASDNFEKVNNNKIVSLVITNHPPQLFD